LLQIVDDAICDNKQDVILLILLGDTHTLSHIIDQLKYRREVRRTVKVNLANRILVCFDYTFDAVAFWIENVAIKCKAVVRSLIEGWDRRTETEGRDFLIGVIVLEYASNTFYCVVVFVLLDVADVVEGSRFTRLDVRKSKVDRN
jgi:hypothetical protein